MSPTDYPSPPPPPPPGSGQAPHGQGTPPPPPPSPSTPPGYGQHGTYPAPGHPGAYPPGGNVAPKPPRPATPIAAILMLAGAVVMVVGTFLTWASDSSGSYNGWDPEFTNAENSTAGGLVFIAVVLAGFGITTLAAKRLLPIAILAVIFAAFGLFAALGELIDLFELSDFFGVEVGVGLWVVLLGAGAALGGAIWTLSVRRKWRAPTPAY